MSWWPLLHVVWILTVKASGAELIPYALGGLETHGQGAGTPRTCDVVWVLVALGQRGP